MKKRVLITRSKEQAAAFARLLEDYGLEAVIFPTIEFVPPEDKTPFSEALKNLPSYRWLILTSANGVIHFIRGLEDAGGAVSDLSGMNICAIGPKTAEAAEQCGLKVDLIPERYQSEGILDAFRKIDIEGEKVLFPRAKEGRDVLPDGLREMGAEVDLLPVYEGIKPEGKGEELREVLKKGIDVLTFTSGATVRNFMEILGDENRDLIKGAKVACISEVTARTAEKLGLKVDIVPEENTTAALAEAVGRFFHHGGKGEM